MAALPQRACALSPIMHARKIITINLIALSIAASGAKAAYSSVQLASGPVLSSFAYDYRQLDLGSSVFDIYWKVVSRPSADKGPGIIRFGVRAATRGWISIGFNTDPGMLGADFAVGW